MFKAIKNWKSENWGGLATTLGNLGMLATGGPIDMLATAIALPSGIVLLQKGHTTWGYSLGCAGISATAYLLCYSQATAGNPALQLMMGVSAGIWAIGALRYPIERAGLVTMKYSKGIGGAFQKTSDTFLSLAGSTAVMFGLPSGHTLRYPNERAGLVTMKYSGCLGKGLQKTADIIQPVVGVATTVIRIPVLYMTAFTGERVNKVMLVCNLFWGANNVLLGKVQDLVKGPIKAFAHYADNLTGNRISKYVVRPTGRGLQSLWRLTKNAGPSD